MQADIQRAASGMQVAAMAPPPTRADYYGYQHAHPADGPADRDGDGRRADRRVAVPADRLPDRVPADYDSGGYGGEEPRRSWARRWLPWLIPGSW